MGRVTSRHPVVSIIDGASTQTTDTLVVEEPLEIRINGEQFSVTMRTPGSDFELAQGFLLTEGIVRHREDISTIRYCDGTDDDGRNTYNLLDIALAIDLPPQARNAQRNLYTTSSCGICGKASLDAVLTTSHFSPTDDRTTIAGSQILAMPDRLRAAQRIFDSTGGLHAAGLFTTTGELLVVREDIGRHNAVDKVIGWALETGRVPLHGTTLMVSGRASFELAQKAIMAGIPILAAVSAPSSLAVDLAREAGLTIAGFVRGGRMNIYSHSQRIV